MSAKLARMHTAEHILSAVMRKHYKAPKNLEFHLNEKKTKCDYDVPVSLSDQNVAQIQLLVNNEIQKNHPVSSFFLNRRDAADYDLWKVPPEAADIRIVKIGEFDAQPCRGEHVDNTQEIGDFRISSYELRKNGRVRIRFTVRSTALEDG